MRDAVENGPIVAACSNQHEAMPDRGLKPQALPPMKDDTYRVNDAAYREKPRLTLGRTVAIEPNRRHPHQPMRR